MANEWIIDVLVDLQDFARNNDMPGLVKQLDESLAVARAEVAAGRRVTAPSAIEHLLRSAQKWPGY
ncbi:hypothetical protein ACMU_14910 [Actibacterium mucosum KCTC 23349]|uniref:Uncharacterized protein n=1 Tax=Actibacterium mucosum KCTC 23349 TaxID=1454373 RepID=A0A037ZHE6_9RHOB|nr:hypothetical protein ACMU_14910 [Actibacterium mucosum KCTC 23349]